MMDLMAFANRQENLDWFSAYRVMYQNRMCVYTDEFAWISLMMASYCDPQLALNQLMGMMDKQQPDGLISTLNSRVSRDSEVNARSLAAPNLGMVFWQLIQDPESKIRYNRDKLEDIYDGLIQYHDYLYEHFDTDDEGLIRTWFDGSSYCTWMPDAIPPQSKKYKEKQNGRYIYDPLFNSLLAASNACLIKLGSYLGRDISTVINWYELGVHSINEILWDEKSQIYRMVDISSNRFLPVHLAHGMMPLIAEVATNRQASKMEKSFKKQVFECDCHYKLMHPHMNAWKQFQYKQSGHWAVINRLICEGLSAYRLVELRDTLKEKTIHLIDHLFSVSGRQETKEMIKRLYPSISIDPNILISGS